MTVRNTLARHLGLNMPQPVPPAGCTDMEAYAEAYGHGFEGALAQDFMTGDQMDPRDWLDGRLARERFKVLTKHADHLPPGLEEVAPAGLIRQWLHLLAEAEIPVAAEPEPVVGDINDAVAPLRDVLTELRTRSRSMGGAASDSYHNAASLIESAMVQMGAEVRRG